MNKWTYLAGFVDGDGSIYVRRRERLAGCVNPTYVLVLSLSNANQELLHWFESMFGKSAGSWESKNYTMSDIRWYGPQAKEIIRKILPYLVGKKKQAQLALTYPCPGRGAPGVCRFHQRAYKKQQEEIWVKMRALNRVWSKGKVKPVEVVNL